MNEVVVFDFDKTLTYKDTILGFFIYCSRNSCTLLFKLAAYYFLMALAKLKVIDNFRLKDLGIKIFMRNLDKDKIEKTAQKYAEHVRIKLLNNIYTDEYSKYSNSYVVSASFYEYLKYLFPRERVIASTICYKDGKSRGLLFNCYGNDKRLKLNKLGIDFIDILFTDSKSDYALAEISRNTFIVKDGELWSQ